MNPRCEQCGKELYYNYILDRYECINSHCLSYDEKKGYGNVYVKSKIQKRVIMFGGRCIVTPNKIQYTPPTKLPKACKKYDGCENCKIVRKCLDELAQAEQVWHDLQRDIHVIKKM